MPGELELAMAAKGELTQKMKGYYDLIDGLRKNKQANTLYKKYKRPTYKRPEEIDQNYDLAGNELGNDYYANYVGQGLRQGLSRGIDTILKSGGNADFETVYSNYGDSLNSAIGSFEQQRAQRLNSFYTQALNKAKAKDAEFQYNIDAPYKDAMAKAALLKTQSQKAIAGYFNAMIGAAANQGTANTKPGYYGNQPGSGVKEPNGIERVPASMSGIAEQPELSNPSFNVRGLNIPPDELIDSTFYNNYR